MKDSEEIVHKKRRFNTKNILIIGIVLVVFVITLVFSTNNFSRATGDTMENKEEALKRKLEKLGGDFYTNFYYPQINNAYASNVRDEFLSRYTATGIKVNLDNLSRYNSLSYNMVEELMPYSDDCNQEETVIVIYPSEPYGSNDFKIEINLVCDFEN